MSTNTVRGFVVLAIIACALFALHALYPQAPDIPRCQEDQVIVGVGDFDDGTWSSYICGPAVDDFVGGGS